MQTQIDSNALIERRFGTIMYTDQILEQNPDIVQKLFSKIIPFKIEFNYIAERFEVEAVSKEFEPVEFGDKIPHYDVIIENQFRKNGVHATYIHFKKREN